MRPTLRACALLAAALMPAAAQAQFYDVGPGGFRQPYGYGHPAPAQRGCPPGYVGCNGAGQYRPPGTTGYDRNSLGPRYACPPGYVGCNGTGRYRRPGTVGYDRNGLGPRYACPPGYVGCNGAGQYRPPGTTGYDRNSLGPRYNY